MGIFDRFKKRGSSQPETKDEIKKKTKKEQGGNNSMNKTSDSDDKLHLSLTSMTSQTAASTTRSFKVPNKDYAKNSSSTNASLSDKKTHKNKNLKTTTGSVSMITEKSLGQINSYLSETDDDNDDENTNK
jgi:hypothetical protein